MKKSNLINETLMYSVQGGGVVTHHLPYARGNPLLEIYTAKGFTFERPALKIDKEVEDAAMAAKDAGLFTLPSETIATPTVVTLEKPKRPYKHHKHRKVKA